MGIVTSFQNILDNIFLPLFEVTVDPGSHPQLHVFLKQVHALTSIFPVSTVTMLSFMAAKFRGVYSVQIFELDI